MKRPLASHEEQLIRWMLAHGNPEARAFLSQLENAAVTPYRCPCGCATINLTFDDHPEPSGDLHVLAEFYFGDKTDLSGIFVFEKSGIRAGLEGYGLAGEAPRVLPLPGSLRPFAT